MKLTRARYQQGSLTREERKNGPDVWVFRWREQTLEGQVKRKVAVGTVQEYRSKAAAQKAVVALRIDINQETWMPSTVEELVTHYREKELPSKTPYTGELYEGYLKTWILPAWGKGTLHEVRTVQVEQWLGTLPLANGTKAKLRNLMHALWNHAMRYEWAGKNPITLVRQSAKRRRVPEVLPVEELNALLSQLKEPFRTMVFVAAVTGLRVSELLALKWYDFNFDAGEITLRRCIVRQRVGEMKTEASRKPLPLDPALADVLMNWRARCAYNQPSDWVFASPDKRGQQPYWPTSAMAKHVRPAAKRAGIAKRIGWHTLRHTFGTLVKSQGADVATTQALMRHANASITMDRYVQAVTPAKRSAQSAIVRMLKPQEAEQLAPCGPRLVAASIGSS